MNMMQPILGPIDLLVMQAGSFCNFNCSYCYLTEEDRRSRRKMDPVVLQKTLENLDASNLIKDGFTIVWHAGEPLVAGIPFYKKAFDIIETFNRGRYRIKIVFQSNGSLISQAWCDFFKSIPNFSIGISVDGAAAHHDANRKDWAGQGTFSKVKAAIEILRRNSISFYTISVLNRGNIDSPDMVFKTLKELGARRICFNIEESDGANVSEMMADLDLENRYRKFMSRVLELTLENGPIQFCREFGQVFPSLHRIPMPASAGHTQLSQAYRIITVDTNGNFTTYSPEFLTMTSEEYGDFVFGNVLHDSFLDIAKSSKFIKVFEDIQEGVELCRNTCEYFNICGGGAPSNKLTENGTLRSADTKYCHFTRKIIAEVSLDYLESKNNSERTTG